MNPSGSQHKPGLQIPLRDERQPSGGIHILMFPLQSVDDALFGSGVQQDVKSKFVKYIFEVEFEFTLPILLLLFLINSDYCHTNFTVEVHRSIHICHA